jgi:hypothetical protein
LEKTSGFGEKKPNHSAPAPSSFLAKNPQMLGSFQAHPGLRARFGEGRWLGLEAEQENQGQDDDQYAKNRPPADKGAEHAADY